jgi:hypothetical protein
LIANFEVDTNLTSGSSTRQILTHQKSKYYQDKTKEIIHQIDIVQGILINNDEICGSELLAEHTLKLELVNSSLDLSDKAQALTFLGNVMHWTNEIAKNRGPLLFVEINKSYYAA